MKTMIDVAKFLPAADALRRICVALSVLDIIVSAPDPLRQDYAFEQEWALGIDIATMENGGGDGYLVAFGPYGVIILGFDHESEMSPYSSTPVAPWPGMLEFIPEAYSEILADLPEFLHDGVPLVTCCAWLPAGEAKWRTGDIGFPSDSGDTCPDGSVMLFGFLTDPDPSAYVETLSVSSPPLAIDAVGKILQLARITPEMVVALNPECSLEAVVDEIAATGYPTS
ncbi:hypothetical protein P3T36_007153 [Kitasatospora sp. MAP12-15]|uniref:hypothetical protein n=1 Tax=unclassified Kitasatospora TaxID=2633591 RepID=UPI0024760ADA|nr:hypothetical protein [Kitasatospora sp. MAP12-44]MDH6108976.1 hypothetical protein [Kitasatospora sp. MAP12-44]